MKSDHHLNLLAMALGLNLVIRSHEAVDIAFLIPLIESIPVYSAVKLIDRI